MPRRSGPSLPLPAIRALQKLGADIRDARRRRRIPTTVMAQRASITRTTLANIEKGDPGSQIGNYASVLFVLGLVSRVGEVADVREDRVGLELEEEHLPQRIRLSSSSRTTRTSPSLPATPSSPARK